MRVIEYFDRGADLYPARDCLHDGARGWISADMRATTHKVANGLPAQGLKTRNAIEDDAAPDPADAPDEVAILISSGGTTGRPKGVQITHRVIIGVIDEDGFVYIVDRKKDMIISGGLNVFPPSRGWVA